MSMARWIRASLAVVAIVGLLGFSLAMAAGWQAEPGTKGEAASEAPQRLTIVWTSGDPEVAHRMVLMYGHAARKSAWFGEVRVIVWGPSARLVAADKEIQAKLAAMKADGVVLEACVVCANSYGVTERLRELGLEVKPMGAPLSEAIKDPTMHLVTF
jgi:hypothetical protein